MARDLMIDIQGRDLTLEDVTDGNTVTLETQWGRVVKGDTDEDMLNILVPVTRKAMIEYDSDEMMSLKASVAYHPAATKVKVRVVIAGKNGELSVNGYDGTPCGLHDLATTLEVSDKDGYIHASELPLLNVDGYLTMQFVKGSTDVYVWSGAESDLQAGVSDDQATKLLAMCGPGKSYRYPTTGVSIYNYLNSVIAHSDLSEKLTEQFGGDGRRVSNAAFDNETGEFELTVTEDNADDETAETEISKLPLNEVGLTTGNEFDTEAFREYVTLSESEFAPEGRDAVMEVDIKCSGEWHVVR